ncbi:hypothetical protein C1645_778062 [Glomus cerebriforme]|uniref:DMT family transporter n=1 Tax=Glomus cerebriforme TaxID=658196 RepID=A0A397SQC1_9GLOM|nr:hypothetical protein C1645_778062 [Glomus cerebriforme]
MAIIAGASAAIQSAIVAKLQVKVGKSFTAFVILVIGTLFTLIYFLIDSKLKTPNFREIFIVETINPWLGGLATAIIIITFMVTIPRLGVAVVLCVVVTSQLILACLIDHFGLFDVTVRRFTWQRGIGCICMIAGVVIISIF